MNPKNPNCKYAVRTRFGLVHLDEGAYQDYLAGKLWICDKPVERTGESGAGWRNGMQNNSQFGAPNGTLDGRSGLGPSGCAGHGPISAGHGSISAEAMELFGRAKEEGPYAVAQSVLNTKRSDMRGECRDDGTSWIGIGASSRKSCQADDSGDSKLDVLSGDRNLDVLAQSPYLPHMAGVHISEMTLSARANNGLRRAGIETVGRLNKLLASEGGIRSVRNLGAKSEQEIRVEFFNFCYALRTTYEKEAYWEALRQRG